MSGGKAKNDEELSFALTDDESGCFSTLQSSAMHKVDVDGIDWVHSPIK